MSTLTSNKMAAKKPNIRSDNSSRSSRSTESRIYLGSYFPIRLRNGVISYGAWLQSYKAEQLRRLNTILKTKIKSTEELEEELKRRTKRKSRDIWKKSSFLFDTPYILKHCKVTDPEEVFSLKIKNQGLNLANTEDFHFFTNLEIIDAEDNLLKLETFAAFTRLVQLKLPLNRLTNISLSFGEFPHLQYLDLSYNNLTGDCFQYLGLMPNLQYLNLGNNNISYLPVDSTHCFSLSNSTKIRYIRFPRLEVLKLDYNKLEHPEIFIPLANMTNLIYLDLEGNSIYHIPRVDKGNAESTFLSQEAIFPTVDSSMQDTQPLRMKRQQTGYYRVPDNESQKEKHLKNLKRTVEDVEYQEPSDQTKRTLEDENLKCQDLYKGIHDRENQLHEVLPDTGVELSTSRDNSLNSKDGMFDSKVALPGSREIIYTSEDISKTSKEEIRKYEGEAVGNVEGSISSREEMTENVEKTFRSQEELTEMEKLHSDGEESFDSMEELTDSKERLPNITEEQHSQKERFHESMDESYINRELIISTRKASHSCDKVLEEKIKKYFERSREGSTDSKRGSESSRKGSESSRKGSHVSRKISGSSRRSSRRKRSSSSRKGSDSSRKGSDSSIRGSDDRKGSHSSRKGSHSSRKGSDSSRKGSDSSRKGSDVSRRSSRRKRSGSSRKGSSSSRRGSDDSRKGSDVSRKGSDVSRKGSDVSRKGSHKSREGLLISKKRSDSSREKLESSGEVSGESKEILYASAVEFSGSMGELSASREGSHICTNEAHDDKDYCSECFTQQLAARTPLSTVLNEFSSSHESFISSHLSDEMLLMEEIPSIEDLKLFMNLSKIKETSDGLVDEEIPFDSFELLGIEQKTEEESPSLSPTVDLNADHIYSSETQLESEFESAVLTSESYSYETSEVETEESEAPIVEMRTKTCNCYSTRPVREEKEDRIPFSQLTILNLAHNNVFCQEALMAVADWPMIQQLFLFGNPIMENTREREISIMAATLCDKLGVDVFCKPLHKQSERHLMIQMNDSRKVKSVIRKVPKVPVEQLMAIENVPISWEKMYKKSSFKRESRAKTKRNVLLNTLSSSDTKEHSALVTEDTQEKSLKSDKATLENADGQQKRTPFFVTQPKEDDGEFIDMKQSAEERKHIEKKEAVDTKEHVNTKQAAMNKDLSNHDKNYSANSPVKSKFKGYEALFDDNNVSTRTICSNDKLMNINALRQALKTEMPFKRRIPKQFTQELVLKSKEAALKSGENYHERIDKILKNIREESVLHEVNLADIFSNRTLYKEEYKEARKLIRQVENYYANSFFNKCRQQDGSQS